MKKLFLSAKRRLSNCTTIRLKNSAALTELRDRGAFESALNAAENRHHYENANLTVCAGTYAFHLCQAHAFVDGNKRIVAAVSILLLRRNGAKIEASIKELIELFLKIAAGEITREAVERFFAENVKIQS